MKIDVLCNDGSPLGVSETTIYGENGRIGVGGAELAILTLMRGWADKGHSVTFYNNPKPTSKSKFKQLPIALFNPKEQRDILIVFRSPNIRAMHANGKKLWLSTDQYTVGNFKEFSQLMDKIITISPFHAEYFLQTYGITNVEIVDLPVRTWEYQQPIQKIRDKLIFCSVPQRGLDILASCYDSLKSNIPNLSLVITSDYRLWGADSPMNEPHIRKFFGKSGVTFRGAIPRTELITEQLSSEILAYPCTYPELFCYAVAECEVAGCYPITSGMGALPTTSSGSIIWGDPNTREWKEAFVEQIVLRLNSKEFKNAVTEMQESAIKRFSLETVLQQWDERVFYA